MTLSTGFFAGVMRDDLGAAAILAEQSFEQVGGAGLAMGDRQAQPGDAGLELVLETGHGFGWRDRPCKMRILVTGGQSTE